MENFNYDGIEEKHTIFEKTKFVLLQMNGYKFTANVIHDILRKHYPTYKLKTISAYVGKFQTNSIVKRIDSHKPYKYMIMDYEKLKSISCDELEKCASEQRKHYDGKKIFIKTLEFITEYKDIIFSINDTIKEMNTRFNKDYNFKTISGYIYKLVHAGILERAGQYTYKVINMNLLEEVLNSNNAYYKLAEIIEDNNLKSESIEEYNTMNETNKIVDSIIEDNQMEEEIMEEEIIEKEIVEEVVEEKSKDVKIKLKTIEQFVADYSSVKEKADEFDKLSKNYDDLWEEWTKTEKENDTLKYRIMKLKEENQKLRDDVTNIFNTLPDALQKIKDVS